jgi:hypothetical protein
MPAARVHPRYADAWTAVERQAGFTRQWLATAGRIRDQLTLATWESISAARISRD